jgi:hypothetical protein
LITAGIGVVRMDVAGNERKVTATAESSGAVNVIFPVHDRFESHFDPRTFCSLSIFKHSEEGSHKRETSIRFDYARKKSTLDEKNLKTGETKHVENDLAGCATDVITGFYYLQSLPLQLGANTSSHQRREDHDRPRHRGKARAHPSAGRNTFPTVMVTAEATSGPLQSKGKVWVWYSEDPSHTPVQMRVKLGWGTLLFRLQRIEKYLGGHEDAIGYNPEQRVLPNADYANNADELIAVMRRQLKEGADFIKIYETGADSVRDGKFHTPYQYTEAELESAVREAARQGRKVAVHAIGEPGTLYAAQAGVASIDHAYQLSDETMRLMREKQIPAVPTFAISEYSADHESTPEFAARERSEIDLHVQEFKKQLAAGVPMAVGSDVGPFPHGTQALELVLMVKFGMTPLQALQADLLNGAKLLDWEGQIGSLEAGYFADVIAVAGDPLQDIGTLQNVSFVMKGGLVYKK